MVDSSISSQGKETVLLAELGQPTAGAGGIGCIGSPDKDPHERQSVPHRHCDGK